MSDINTTILTGRLTEDAELKIINDDLSLSKFSIASTWRSQDKESTLFIDCVMFGKRVEKLTEFLTKGKQVTVQGELRQETWEKEGVKKSKISLVVNQLVLPPKPQS